MHFLDTIDSFDKRKKQNNSISLKKYSLLHKIFDSFQKNKQLIQEKLHLHIE
jgi:hypothetical protein